MPTLDDVHQLAMGLDGVSLGSSYRHTAWNVGKKSLAWERPLSKADVKRFGTATPPAAPLLAVAVADLDDKEAVLAVGHAGVFTIEHFNGFAAVLIELDVVSADVLRDLIVDAWMAVAPQRMVTEYLRRNESGTTKPSAADSEPDGDVS